MRAARVSPTAPLGSLFKTGAAPKRQAGRAVKVSDATHLDAVRQCACLSCGAEHQTEAAHVRMSRGKGTGGGVGMRPSNALVVPLCSKCHRDQHSGSEAGFWAALNIDPIRAALALYQGSPDTELMRQIVMVFRAAAVVDGDGAEVRPE